MVFNATWYFLIKEDYYQLGNWYSTMFVIKDKLICAGVFIGCLSMYWRWRSSYQEGEGAAIGVPFTGLTPPHICACPNSGPGFSTWYVVVFFVFSEFSYGERGMFVLLISMELMTISI